MKYFFLSSSHLEDRIWFRDDEDFKVGMNYVALAAVRREVAVLVFVLMSNHVHFVLYGTDGAAMHAFYDYFKMLYSRYIRAKYGSIRFLRDNSLDCQPIQTTNESLERVIAYVLMNPVAANICLHPTGYQWGCGNCFFTGHFPSGRLVMSLGYRERRRLLHTNLPFRKNDVLGEADYILPESFVRKDMVEAIFHSPKRMDYFLNTSSKARKLLESENAILPSFRDQGLIIMAQDICISLFRKTDPSLLEANEEQRLVYEVRRRSGADIKQLARVLNKQPAEIAAILAQY